MSGSCSGASGLFAVRLLRAGLPQRSFTKNLRDGSVDIADDIVCDESSSTPMYYYLWRPFLPDPKDDLVLEVAVAGRCDTIVTFNHRDFRGVDKFGLHVQTPRTFLEELES